MASGQAPKRVHIMAYERRRGYGRIQGKGAQKRRIRQKKIHYSLFENRAICGMKALSVSRFRTDVTCRACKRLMRNLGKKVPKNKVAHTLIVVGSHADRTVYLDVSRDEATSRYIEEYGDTPTTRDEIEKATVLDINDQFRIRDL
jgi:hypothetical protein